MGIDGLAVVSAIIAQSDIKAAAAELKGLFCGKEKKNRILIAAIFDFRWNNSGFNGCMGAYRYSVFEKRNLPVPEIM